MQHQFASICVSRATAEQVVCKQWISLPTPRISQGLPSTNFPSSRCRIQAGSLLHQNQQDGFIQQRQGLKRPSPLILLSCFSVSMMNNPLYPASTCHRNHSPVPWLNDEDNGRGKRSKWVSGRASAAEVILCQYNLRMLEKKLQVLPTLAELMQHLDRKTISKALSCCDWLQHQHRYPVLHIASKLIFPAIWK